MKRRLKLNIKKNLFYKKINKNYKIVRNNKIFELINQKINKKGKLHPFYIYLNFFLRIIKRNFFFENFKFNNKLISKSFFIPMYLNKKQIFYENVRIYSFFKSKNEKNFYLKKYFYFLKNNDNINVTTFDKDDEKSLFLLKTKNDTKILNNQNNLYNFNNTIYLNNLKVFYEIIIILLIKKIIFNN